MNTGSPTWSEGLRNAAGILRDEAKYEKPRSLEELADSLEKMADFYDKKIAEFHAYLARPGQ